MSKRTEYDIEADEIRPPGYLVDYAAGLPHCPVIGIGAADSVEGLVKHIYSKGAHTALVMSGLDDPITEEFECGYMTLWFFALPAPEDTPAESFDTKLSADSTVEDIMQKLAHDSPSVLIRSTSKGDYAFALPRPMSMRMASQ